MVPFSKSGVAQVTGSSNLPLSATIPHSILGLFSLADPPGLETSGQLF